MGIGAAFATGLVKGFTQNIQEEKARRLAEQQKIDAFEQTALQSVLTGKATKSGYAAVSQLIKSARQDIKERPDIDIFGRATDGIDIDFASLQGTLEDATQDYIQIGSVKLKVPEKYFDPASDAQDKANMFMDSLNREIMASPADQEAFFSKFKSERDIQALENMYRGQLGQWVRTRGFDKEGKLIVNVDPTSQLDVHPAISSFLGWNVDKEYETHREAAIRKLGGTTDLPANYALLPVGLNASKGALAIPLSELGFTEPDQIQGLEGIAKFQNMDTQKFIYNFASQYDSQAEFMEGLAHSVKLFNLGAANPTNFTQQEEVGKYLMSQPDLKDDALARAHAMAPFTKDLVNPARRTLNSIGIEAYKDIPFAEEFQKITGQKLVDFETNASNVGNARSRLSQLQEAIRTSGVKAESGLASIIMGIYGFAGETGTVDQAMNFIGGNFEEGSEGKIRQYIKNDIESSKTQSIAMAKTLAYIVAGDLARAEDPSGRLSDQDFIRNYNKLGMRTAGTLQDQLKAISVIQDEIEKKYSDLEVMSEIVARGKAGSLAEGDRKIIRGDALAKQAVKRYNSTGGVMMQDLPQPEVQLPSFEAVTTKADRYEPYPIATGKDGGAVYRDKQTGSMIVTSNGVVTQQIPGANVRDAFASQTLVRSSPSSAGSAPVVSTAAPAPAAPVAPAPAADVTPAPVAAQQIEYLDVAGTESGNNQQGYTLEGRPGKYKKVNRPDGTAYFEPMK